ncbi:MAG: hypothetical protein F4140_07370 [Cenarchaeum sp. SB0675_bin_21]|nr:hypothetical protein [Cenarchaeum sp. SB0675_bin_21]
MSEVLYHTSVVTGMASLGQPTLLCLAVTVTASLAVLSITVGAEENLAAYATAPSVLPPPGLANNVAITEISGGTYAVVANLHVNPNFDDGNWTAAARVGVSIINVTYPAAPTTVAGTIDDADGFTHVVGASIAVSQISGGTYAVVANTYNTGIQIINITDPASPLRVVGQTDGADGFDVLDRPAAIAISEISGGTYAVTTHFFGVMQIINITDPANPATVADIIDNSYWINQGRVALDEEFNISVSETSTGTYMHAPTEDGRGVRIINVTGMAAPTLVAELPDGVSVFGELGWPWVVSVSHVSGGTYAVVAKGHDDGVQIINITDPSAPAIVNGTFEITNGFTHLYGATGVEIAEISGRMYAVVASIRDNGLQIVDITDPASPISTAAVTDGVDGFTALSGAFEVSVWGVSNRTYAAVASVYDSGLQIVDITDPANPFPVVDITDITDPVSGGYTTLRGTFDVTVFETSGRTYAVAASIRDNSLQIFDITNPSAPAPVINITDDLDEFAGLTVTGIEIAEIDSRTYVVIASEDYGSVQIIDITDPANPFPLPSPHSTTRPDSG